jgi:predicted lipoprotein with Yx(FWY)xxD motif
MRHRWAGRSGVSWGVLVLALGVLLGPRGPLGDTARALAQATPTVQTRETSTLGTVLTGSNGKTLYNFDRDMPGVSNCNDACPMTWPPLTLDTGTPSGPPGLAGTLSVITRGDGRRQVTYNGRPLYFYAPDTAPGDTKGDGIGGVWHAAKPLAAAPAPPAAPAGPAPSGLPRTGTGSARAGSLPASGVLGGLVLAVLVGGMVAVGRRRHA